MARSGLLVVALVVASWVAPSLAWADGAWLDAPVVNWNTPGMSLPPPLADPAAPVNSLCAERQTPPHTALEETVAAAGWTAFSPTPEGKDGVTIIIGSSGYDGMCRPLGFQAFVFVDAIFTGTLSPVLMDSRSDGALNRSTMTRSDRIEAFFSRYVEDDPRCCPSAVSKVTFRIDKTVNGPLLTPLSVITTFTPREPAADDRR